jgi:hypothetical protein
MTGGASAGSGLQTRGAFSTAAPVYRSLRDSDLDRETGFHTDPKSGAATAEALGTRNRLKPGPAAFRAFDPLPLLDTAHSLLLSISNQGLDSFTVARQVPTAGRARAGLPGMISFCPQRSNRRPEAAGGNALQRVG